MATMQEVSDEVLAGLKQTLQMPRVVAANLHTLTLDRIFTKGLNSAGSQIGTYTPFTIRKKKEKGRFTSNRVNLRDSEQFVNAYVFHCSGKSCAIGFANTSRNDSETNSKLKTKLETQYGPIFDLTAQEDAEIDEIILDELENIQF